MRRLNEHVTERDLGSGLHEITIQRGHNYYDRDAQAYLETPKDLLADDRSAGFSHVHKGAAWKRIGKGGLHRVGFGQGKDATYLPAGAADVTPTIEGNVARYANLWPSTDVAIEVFPEGIKETLVLRESAAPKSFSWDVITRSAILDPSGAFIDPLQSRTVGRIVAPTAHDTNGNSVSVTMTCTAETVTLEVGEGVYPITVDPTTTIQSDGTAGIDAGVRSNGGYQNTNFGTNAYLWVGVWSAGDVFRSLLTNGFSAVPADATVSAASLQLLFQAGTYAVTADAFSITQAWDEGTVTWTNQPTKDATKVSTATIPTTEGWVSWDGLASLVNAVRAGTKYGFILVDQGEAGSTNTRRQAYSSDDTTATNRPKWVITYSYLPTPTSPVGTSTSPGSIADDLTPRLSWSNNIAVTQSKYQVQIADTADNLKVDSGQVSSANTYYDVLAGAGLVYGTTYKWRVQVYDGANWTGYTDWRYFRCTINPPTNLTVTPDADHANIGLTWTASTAESLAGYGVMRKVKGADDNTAVPLNLTTISETTYTDDTAASGTEYQYAAYCVTTNGHKGANSAWVDGTVTFPDAWVGTSKIVRADVAQALNVPRNASTETTLNGTAKVDDYGYGPRQIYLAIVYKSVAERESIFAMFPADTAKSYRGFTGEVLRGKVTACENHPQNVPNKVWGYVTVELTEVKPND